MCDNNNYDKKFHKKDYIYTGICIILFILLCGFLESIW